MERSPTRLSGYIVTQWGLFVRGGRREGKEERGEWRGLQPDFLATSSLYHFFILKLQRGADHTMSVDDEIAVGQVLGADEEEILSSLSDDLERSSQQLDLDALHAAEELLRREINELRSARNIVEAQSRAEFLQRLSSIVTDGCCKLEAKMHVSFSRLCSYSVAQLHSQCLDIVKKSCGDGRDLYRPRAWYHLSPVSIQKSQCSEFGFSKIQDGGRPPFWISILAHNFHVDQRFCAKFSPQVDNGQPKGTHCSEIWFTQIQRRRTAAVLDFDFRP